MAFWNRNKEEPKRGGVSLSGKNASGALGGLPVPETDYDIANAAISSYRRCIELISKTCAGVPVRIVDEVGNTPSIGRGVAGSGKVRKYTERFSECGSPDDKTNTFRWFMSAYAELASYGNVFLALQGDDIRVGVLNPEIREATDTVHLVDIVSGTEFSAYRDNVEHITQPNPTNFGTSYTDVDGNVFNLYGTTTAEKSLNSYRWSQGYMLTIPSVWYLRTTFNNNIDMQEVIKQALDRAKTGGNIVSTLRHNYTDQTELEDYIERIRSQFEQGRSVKVTDAETKTEKVGDTMQQEGHGLDMIHRIINTQVGQMMGVPSRLLFIDTGQGAAEYAAVNEEFNNSTVMAYLRQVRCGLNRLIFKGTDFRFVHNIPALKMGTAHGFSTYMAGIKDAREAGVLDNPAIREALGLWGPIDPVQSNE